MGDRSAREIWEATLGELQVQVSKSNYRTWLEKTGGLSYEDGQFVVSVPNTFVAEYLAKNQRSLIEKTLINIVSSPDIRVTFRVDGKHQSPARGQRGDRRDPDSSPVHASMFKANYVFESFVVGSCNQLAFSAAQAVAQNPGQSYNPLFIYGEAGLGKTHLLHAIGQVAAAKDVTVLCVSAEQFTNEFVSAIRERKTEEFRSKYRNAGMLLVDDIHFISGKEQTAESFFHTFNELHNANRQIVITSDQPPKSMTFLEERLRSRFEWGLTVDIQPPAFETRLAILQSKAQQKGLEATLEVLEFIAEQIKQNIRELEGSLNRVIAYANLLSLAPTVEIASKALENLAGKEPSVPNVTTRLVLEAVSSSFQMSPEDLTGGMRDKETTLARRVAMYMLRRETNYSVAQIGEELGGRDPSAVTNACKKIASDITENRYLSRKILEIQKRLNNSTNIYKN
jgi:chromosomal replication initiator protein